MASSRRGLEKLQPNSERDLAAFTAGEARMTADPAAASLPPQPAVKHRHCLSGLPRSLGPST
ncbi:Hypothetical predicted protein [Podarcis lilfordi]|uniref:Uncharacterized protein n=1 Tax=Podarcis lilfordi TaxID=74358 RepID=A0AA35KR22_9SAUR|nr:Hypothetical predicted protein [Podarcis lilfordi]